MSVRKFLTSAVLCGLLAGVFSAGNVAMAVTVDENNAAVGGESVITSPNQYPDVEGKRIVINTASRGLYLYNQGVKTRLYPIACGKPSTPTPVGYYKLIDKEYNPTWTDPSTGYSIGSGPDCPLGYRWMGFIGNYGIHGTNRDSSIGSYASNGCIRMHEEDVEELFELVPMSTPVDITYNRVVVEKADDDTVVYYVYPDGYGWQPVTNADVNTWLKGFGVDAFVSEDEITQKVSAADGNPTYIAKAYTMVVDGKKAAGKAVIREGITYLPVIPIAEASKIDVGNNGGLLVSKYGKVSPMIFKDQVFINADDAYSLFGMQGGLAEGVYSLRSVNTPVITKPAEKPVTAPENNTTPAATTEPAAATPATEATATQAPVTEVKADDTKTEAKTEAKKDDKKADVKAEAKKDDKKAKADAKADDKKNDKRHSFNRAKDDI